jgi:hypothetical protein
VIEVFLLLYHASFWPHFGSDLIVDSQLITVNLHHLAYLALLSTYVPMDFCTCISVYYLHHCVLLALLCLTCIYYHPMNMTKKLGTRTATVAWDVPDYLTCKNMYPVAANAYHQATDKSEALHALWEIACSLGALGKFVEGKECGFKEGKECGLEEGCKLGLEEGRRLGLDEGRKLGLEEGKKREEGDFNRMFNQGARQGKADERNWWVEAGHCEQDMCM